MKILWLGHNLAYPPKGGVLQRNYNLLRQAAKAGEVHVVAFDQPATRQLGTSREDCVTELRKFCSTVEVFELPRARTRASKYLLALRALLSPRPYDVEWLRSAALAVRLATLSHRRFDVVHVDTIGLAPYVGCVPGVAIVLNHHNVESVMIERRAALERHSLKRLYFRREAAKLAAAEAYWCEQFDRNMVVSEEEGARLSRHCPSARWTVVANGVDVEYFRPVSEPCGARLLFCGGLTWYPNEDAMRFFFEDVWPLLIRNVPEVEMCVIGRSPPAWLQRLARHDSRVRVTGFIDDVRPFFRKATVYVCPIRDGGGTRLKILDALAMGLPLVATRFACSGIDVKDGEHVLYAETPEEFVSQIRRVVDDAALWRSLSSSGRTLVEQHYSWDTIGRELRGAYEAAIGHRSQPASR